MTSTDPFHILGLQPGAARDEIRRSYRKLAMRWHPDRNQHSKASEERFKQIKTAYEIAIDEEAYRAWKVSRPATAEVKPKETRSRKTASPEDAPPIEQTLELTLEEAAQGGHRSISVTHQKPCKTCAGKGRVDHPHSIACALCKGIGRLRGKSLFTTENCPECAGRGYVRHVECKDCGGLGHERSQSFFEVQVPAGLRHGETLRLARAGGSILLQVAHAPHPFFTLQGNDLLCEIPVDVLTFIAGGEIEVPTLGKNIRVPLPLASLSAQIRLVGKGFPRRHGKGAGDLILTLQAVFPKALSPTETAQLHQLAASWKKRTPELQDWDKRQMQREKPPKTP